METRPIQITEHPQVYYYFYDVTNKVSAGQRGYIILQLIVMGSLLQSQLWIYVVEWIHIRFK